MTSSYRLTEDDFYKLQRVQVSMKGLVALLEEHQRTSTLTPKMLAAYLDMAEEDMAVVLQAVGTTFTTR
ncbi:hypothetical protein [Pseudomonas sp. CDFA 610]|uniref:hypothetical protein n=1 Tax=Pseudomonas sp. CDFA 610 TaxID=2829825 RepID=UPI001E4C2E8C|nr:hypothetical protein [Pseudomonas sp. CDFA 610]MCD5982768.1 hypothetical protein [Pseudomonas sp. CDFA 610]